MTNPYASAGMAAAIATLVGFGAGYQVNRISTNTKVTKLEAKITELETKAAEAEKLEVPTDDEATAALQKTTFKGSSMRISECQANSGFPGVVCFGTVTTTGEFGGSRPATLPFAKIGGVWTYAR
ncbi:MAG: hypothetical protein E5V75_28420 [Mesorhizobium sp.]|nr:MAG: hypothetical protein E5V75_28420 [Mesorhizobium sp.]